MRRFMRWHRLVRTLAAGFVLGSAASPARAQTSALLAGLLSRDAAAGRALNPLATEFAQAQLKHPRVLNARINARHAVKQLFHRSAVPYPAAEIFMRVFKRERTLELWARPAGGQRFVLLKAYPICALAGEIGPKRREGDNQTPEGFYEIDAFNPNSEYLLSLHISYPNASDRALGRRAALGGAIYLHGGCRTVGCIAVTDDAIEELYWIAVEARAAGQLRVPVHIFPAHLTDEEMARLAGAFRGRTELLAFWENLRPGYEHFERLRVPPAVTIDSNGRYMFSTAVRVRRGDAALPAGR